VFRRITSTIAAAATVAALVAACGSTTPTAAPPTFVPPTTAAATPTAPTPTAEPTATLAPSPTGPYDGQPYSLTLPESWVSFDMSDPAGQAALDAFVTANPDMAGSIEAFKQLPNVVMAVNQGAGDVIVSISLPSSGATLDAIAASFTSQFAAVPGIQEAPTADDVTLPVGPAKHWHLVIEANKPSGGTTTVGESIYLAANTTTAVLVEFVEVGGAPVAQEQEIIQSLAIK
jgi:hypothetical protein